MTWAIPNWYALSLLGLAAFRLWRLLAEDDILNRPRDRLSEWSLLGHWDREGEPGNPAMDFVMCPWCFGAWIAVGWWLTWIWQPHWTLVIAIPFALSALVGLIGSRLDPE